MRKILFLIISLVVLNSNASSIEKVIELSAKIEKNKFYSYGISEFKFDKEKVDLEFNEEQTKIKDLNSNLIIKTTIPKGEIGYSYNIIATELNSECYLTSNSNVVYSDFAKYILDNKEIMIDVNTHFNQFNNICDDMFCDNLKFKVKFNDTPLNGKSMNCHGVINLTIGLKLV
ncbi:TPA: hypothetical protein ACX6R6_001469 [Photobacterium damselae]